MEVYVLNYIRTNANNKPYERGCIVYKNEADAKKQASYFKEWGYIDVYVVKGSMKMD